MTQRRPYVVAHRGASGDAPENTAAAIALAAGQGADVCEVDARLTADGVLAVVHDDTLSRTTDCARVLPDRAPWRVADLTWNEISRLTAGVHDGEPQRVPTLGEVVAQTRALGLGLLVELKPGSDDGALERAVADCLRAPGDPAWLAERVLLGCFDVISLERSRDAIGAGAPELAFILGGLVARDGVIGHVEPVTPGLAEPGMTLTALRDGLGARGVAHLGMVLFGLHGKPATDVDAATVEWLRAGGVELNLYANEPAEMSALLRLGLSSVLTDHPGRFVALRDAAA